MIQHEEYLLYAADTWVIPVKATKLDGSPINLNGATLLWGLFSADTRQLIVSPADVSVTVDDAAAGTATVTVPSTKTALVPGPVQYFDVFIVQGSGIKHTTWTGPIRVNPSFS